MGFLSKLFGPKQDTPTPSDNSAMQKMREAMDVARFARRAESYDQAYDALQQAMAIADEQKDTHSTTVIALHQADILIDQKRYDEAEQLLQTVQQAAESVNQRGFVSYALTSLGNLQVGRGQWDQARTTYEEAREVAARAEAAGPEGRAMGYLADVYLHDNNASFAIHLLEEALPKLNEAGDLEMSSYFVGRLGEAMLVSGQQVKGRQMLERALRLGEQMRDRRMTRRWTVALGNTAYEADQYDEAYMFFKRALELLGDDIVTPDHAQTFTRLSRLSLSLGEPDDALAYAEKAVDSADTLQDTVMQAAARGALGMALRANGKHAEAVPHLEAAVTASSGTVDALYIRSLRYLAAAQMDAAQLEAARQTYDRALSLAKDAGLDLPLGNVYRDFGLFHAKSGDLRQAVAYWTEALGIFEDKGDQNQAARVLCDLANSRRQLGLTKRALTDYENALVALNHVDDLATRGLVLANAANAYTDQGDIESSSAFFKEAIEIAQKIDDREAYATRLGNYGWFLTGKGEPRKAIENLTQALETSRSEGLTLHVAIQTDNLGLAYDALSQYKTALQHHEQALATLAELDPVPARWQALFEANTSRTKAALGYVEDAAELATRALKTARNSGDFEVIVIALLAQGRVLLHQAKPEAAITHIQEALTIAQRASLRRLQAESYHLYSEQQAAVGEIDQAREYWQQATKLYRMVGASQARQSPFWLDEGQQSTSQEEDA